MRYAVAVADEGHFGRAASRLLMTQPSLSRQVRALEREIGHDLFLRTRRGAELTTAGAEFVTRARRTLHEVDAVVRRTQEVGLGASGHVCLGFVATAAIDLLPRALANLRVEHPGTVVTLQELTTEEQVTGLVDGDLDVGLGRDVRPHPDLSRLVLGDERVVVALPARHPLARREQLSLADLSGWAAVKLPRERARVIDDLLLRVPGARDPRPPGAPGAAVQEANQYMTLLALVAADMGVALVPESVQPLQRSGVTYVPLSEPEATTSLMVTTVGTAPPPAAQQLRDSLARAYAELR